MSGVLINIHSVYYLKELKKPVSCQRWCVCINLTYWPFCTLPWPAGCDILYSERGSVMDTPSLITVAWAVKLSTLSVDLHH